MAEDRGSDGSNATAPVASAASVRSHSFSHLPSLDGLRAAAVVLVMGYHAGLPGLSGGRVGVDVFFVLSGFLITAILLDEAAQNGSIRLPAFYMRRVLRLYPALIVAAGLALALAALKIPLLDASSRSLDSTLEGLPFSLLYTMNLARAADWTGGGYLGHTWSLAIEEQFYLVWPLVVMAVMGRGRFRPGLLGLVAVLCAVASAACRTGLAVAGVGESVLFNATFSHVDGIFAGCALAVAWSMRLGIVRRLGHPIVTAGAGLALVTVILRAPGLFTYGFLVATLASVAVVASLLSHPGSVVGKMLSLPAMVEIGKRSYGLYLFHWPIFQFLGVDAGPPKLVLGFGLTFLAAWLSFGIVERRFLRMKGRWASRAQAVTADVQEPGPPPTPARPPPGRGAAAEVTVPPP